VAERLAAHLRWFHTAGKSFLFRIRTVFGSRVPPDSPDLIWLQNEFQTIDTTEAALPTGYYGLIGKRSYTSLRSAETPTRVFT
jgi:hypothetical protein